MLIDLLSSNNYILVNKDAIHILGLNTAIYCAELLNIYKKAKEKDKLTTDNYFKVDRSYIKKQTSLNTEDQLKCDTNLEKVNIIKIDVKDPDTIRFDIETFASIITSEDIKLLDTVAETVQTDSRKLKSVVKDKKRERMIVLLKESIICRDLDITYALRDWIDALLANPDKYMTKEQVKIFKDRIDDYCNGDKVKALNIIKIATLHSYIDCNWAINLYEKDLGGIKGTNSTTKVRTTDQKVTTKLGTEVF